MISFNIGNLQFHSLNLFEPGLYVEDKEIYLQDFKTKLEEKFDLKSFDIIHAHYWLSGLVAKQISEELNIPYIFTSHSLGVFLEGYNKERVDCEKMIMTSSSFTTASSSYENVLISEYTLKSRSLHMECEQGKNNLILFTPKFAAASITFLELLAKENLAIK